MGSLVHLLFQTSQPFGYRRHPPPNWRKGSGGLFLAFPKPKVDAGRVQQLDGIGQQGKGLLLAAVLGRVFKPSHQHPVGVVVELLEFLRLVVVHQILTSTK